MSSYRFELLPSGILFVTVSGLLSPDEAMSYIAEMRDRLDLLRKQSGFSRVLVDGRESPVQPANIMALFENFQSFLVVGERDRAAYVVKSVLSKMQAQRLAAGDQLQIFVAIDEATEWLLS